MSWKTIFKIYKLEAYSHIGKRCWIASLFFHNSIVGSRGIWTISVGDSRRYQLVELQGSWQIASLNSSLYSLVDQLCWKPSYRGIFFMTNLFIRYYIPLPILLSLGRLYGSQRCHQRLVFFLWTTASGRILTTDKL